MIHSGYCNSGVGVGGGGGGMMVMVGVMSPQNVKMQNSVYTVLQLIFLEPNNNSNLCVYVKIYLPIYLYYENSMFVHNMYITLIAHCNNSII